MYKIEVCYWILRELCNCVFAGSEVEIEDDEDAMSDTMDTLDMPSTLNSQLNGSVENGVDTTPVPTETNMSNPLKQLSSMETPMQLQQSNLQFTDSFLNHDPKYSNHVSTTSSQFLVNQRPNIAPLHVECDPVGVFSLL